jgi:hypothetical protein
MRRRACWTTAAILAAALQAPAAAESATSWRVSGLLSGTYDNSAAWEQCVATGATGNASEHVDLDVRLRPYSTARYTRGDPQFGARVNIDVGGRWTVAGSYAPRQRDVNGNESCSAPVQFTCSGAVTNPYRQVPAGVLFQRRGRTFVGQFTSFAAIREDQSAQPSACNPAEGDDSLAMGPLFGLIDTTAHAPLVDGLYSVPVARLNGRRSFTVSPTPNPTLASPCSYLYLSCSQNNQLVMRLSFKPVR